MVLAFMVFNFVVVDVALFGVLFYVEFVCVMVKSCVLCYVSS